MPMLTPEELQEAYDSITSNTTLPSWYTSTLKSILSKNITINDWNKLQEDIQKLAIDDHNTLDLVNLIYSQILVTTIKILALEADGSVTTSKLADDSVTNDKITDGAVTNAKIANYSVTTAKLAPQAVGPGKIYPGSVQNAEIGDGAVTTDKIYKEAVTTLKLANSSVTTDKINDGAVTAAKIEDGTITTAKLEDGAVNEDKIADEAVTENTIADEAVTSAKIADKAVTPSKLSQDLQNFVNNALYTYTIYIGDNDDTYFIPFGITTLSSYINSFSSTQIEHALDFDKSSASYNITDIEILKLIIDGINKDILGYAVTTVNYNDYSFTIGIINNLYTIQMSYNGTVVFKLEFNSGLTITDYINTDYVYISLVKLIK